MRFSDYLLALIGCSVIWVTGTILHNGDINDEQQKEITQLQSSINVLTEKNIRLDEELLNLNSHNDELNHRLSTLEVLVTEQETKIVELQVKLPRKKR